MRIAYDKKLGAYVVNNEFGQVCPLDGQVKFPTYPALLAKIEDIGFTVDSNGKLK